MVLKCTWIAKFKMLGATLLQRCEILVQNAAGRIARSNNALTVTLGAIVLQCTSAQD